MQPARNSGHSGTCGTGSVFSGRRPHNAGWCQHRSCPVLSRWIRMPSRSFRTSLISSSRDMRRRSSSTVSPIAPQATAFITVTSLKNDALSYLSMERVVRDAKVGYGTRRSNWPLGNLSRLLEPDADWPIRVGTSAIAEFPVLVVAPAVRRSVVHQATGLIASGRYAAEPNLRLDH